MALTVDRIDHVVLNCRDVEVMRREFHRAPNWDTGAVDAPGSLDLCFNAAMRADDMGADLRASGIEVASHSAAD